MQNAYMCRRALTWALNYSAMSLRDFNLDDLAYNTHCYAQWSVPNQVEGTF